jgi:hypothetical protein
MQFKKPASQDHKTATFQDGSRSIVVDRKDVALSDYDGQAGTVQWGIKPDNDLPPWASA